jgi:hypothetical protein
MVALCQELGSKLQCEFLVELGSLQTFTFFWGGFGLQLVPIHDLLTLGPSGILLLFSLPSTH